jgi:hypothetical protein
VFQSILLGVTTLTSAFLLCKDWSLKTQQVSSGMQ